MSYSKDDVEELARWVLYNTTDYDRSGGITTHGRKYCTSCHNYENDGKITHHHSCITKIAQDILTGSEEGQRYRCL